MDSDKISSDVLIQELGGCGRFQVVLCALVPLVYISWSQSYLFMAFGSYNPGWRCLDNVTTTPLNNSLSITPLEYQTESCEGFDNCQDVEFNPEAFTIVTEFGLVCDKKWMVSLIMTVQVVGAAVGMILVGFLGDKFGRKKTLYSFVLADALLLLISRFSMCVEMFIVVRFFIGISGTVMGYLPLSYMVEFMPPKWRIVLCSLPFWTLGSILFAVSAMLSTDWRLLHILAICSSLAFFVSVVWVPESLRWLAIHGKEKECLNVAEKVARLNRTNVNYEHCITLMQEEASNKTNAKTSSFIDLFKKGYRWYPVSIGLTFLIIDLFYFVASFGVSTLPGNIFINMIILSVAELPAYLLAGLMPNKFGRKKTVTISVLLMSIFLFGVVAMELTAVGKTREIGIVTLVVVARMISGVAYFVIAVWNLELYPTQVRATASGYSGFMATVGTIIAPHLIPTKQGMFYISYLVMAITTLISACLLLAVPETKGKPLQDTWKTTPENDTNQDGEMKVFVSPD